MMVTGKLQITVCFLCTYIEYYDIRLSYFPQIALNLIGIFLEYLVQNPPLALAHQGL